MPYYDGTCDECGAPADDSLTTPMYCLCADCYDADVYTGEDAPDFDEEG